MKKILLFNLFISYSFCFIFISHRTAPKLHGMENSLNGIQEILKLQKNIGNPKNFFNKLVIEFDIRTSIDGDLIIMHDETLDRTTTGHGYVNKLKKEGTAYF
jgi:hypothetical protein